MHAHTSKIFLKPYILVKLQVKLTWIGSKLPKLPYAFM